jgi:hypothetical protein
MSSEQLKNHLKRNCLGRKNAVKSPELEQALRISGNELRRQVNRLRRKKVHICSGPEGYFYAGNAGEIYATIRSLEIMARGLEHAVEGLEAALENFGEHPGGDAP